MCTALTLTTSDTYFGRNLDLEYTLGEELVVMPRHFMFPFRHLPIPKEQYAMLGTAYVPDGLPLFYDAVNEHGLAVAGLNFPQYAQYGEPCDGALAPFEVIPYLLGRCKTVRDVCACLADTPIAAINYSDRLPATPLHWCVADAHDCVAIEPMADGVRVIPNPVGVLTNSPPLSFHLAALSSFTSLSPDSPPDRFGGVPLSLYSRGMGSDGLPGGYSSGARFVRAAFGKVHATCDNSEEQSVMQMFHLLDSVAMPRGSVRMPDGRFEITVYSSCCNLRTGAYYYKTYNGSHIRAVDLHMDDQNGACLYRRPMKTTFDIRV